MYIRGTTCAHHIAIIISFGFIILFLLTSLTFKLHSHHSHSSPSVPSSTLLFSPPSTMLFLSLVLGATAAQASTIISAKPNQDHFSSQELIHSLDVITNATAGTANLTSSFTAERNSQAYNVSLTHPVPSPSITRSLHAHPLG